MTQRFTVTIDLDTADQVTLVNLRDALIGVENHLAERQQDACPGSEARHIAVFDNDPETDVARLTELRDSLKTVIDWMG